jgi:regulator of RNase E activity RraA
LIRDLPGILPLEIPVFARGTTPIGPLHRGPGEVNYPIVCGGVVVHPGDIIVGDEAGTVVVPADAAWELLRRLKGHEAANAAYLAAVQRGEFSNEWVDRLLTRHECAITGERRKPVLRESSDPSRSFSANVASVVAPNKTGEILP